MMNGQNVVAFDVLEPRHLLAASPVEVIAGALDLPADVTVGYTGTSQALARANLDKVGGLLGFPTGRDRDFLLLSTGLVSEVTSSITDDHGTDIGDPGNQDDTATVTVNLPVPESAHPQTFRFDFMFLSDEYPIFVGDKFNDFFTATVNGQNIALDQNGNQVNINNVFFDPSLSVTGTKFNGRTEALTATYRIPTGTNNLNIVLSLGDVGDASYDSAVFLDNFRITPRQVVYLNFDGRFTGDLFWPNTKALIDEFKAADVGSTAPDAQVINSILQLVQQEYAPYDIQIVTSRPTSGVFTQVIVGGGADTLVEIATSYRPAFNQMAREKNLPILNSPLVTMDYFETVTSGDFTTIGIAAEVDIGNVKPDELAVVFAKQVAKTKSSDVRFLEVAETIIHEIGHAVGLTHVDDTASLMYFQGRDDTDDAFLDKLTPRRPTEIKDAQKEAGFTHQNDHQYLLAVLGSSNPGGSGSLAASFSGEATSAKPSFQVQFQLSQATPIFNAVIGTHDPTVDVAPQFRSLSLAGGKAVVPLPTLGPATQLFIYGSSTPGGPIDLVLGKFNGDEFTTAMSLFSVGGNLNTNLEVGKINGDQVVPYTTGTIAESETLGGSSDNAGNTVAAAFSLGTNGKVVPPAGILEGIGGDDTADFYKLVLKTKGAAKTTIVLNNLAAPVKLAYGNKLGKKFSPIKQISSSGSTARLKIKSVGGKQVVYLRVTPGTSAAITDYLMSISQKTRTRLHLA